MPPRYKRFRIECGSPGMRASRPVDSALRTQPSIERAVLEPRARSGRGGAPEWLDVERLAAELHAMRAAIATTKSEIADIKRSPSGADGIQRATGELDAVSAATESATTSILAAVEEIEMAANLLRSTGAGPEGAGSVDVILDRVLVLYEACNFQDITGQRIRKVITTLKFVEERLDRVIAAWGAAPSAPSGLLSELRPATLCGPCLPGDPGHVTQSDVDAFFA